MQYGSSMARGVVCAAAVVAALTPAGAWAQTPEQIENAARSQAFVFERALRGAVELGGQQLAKRALVMVPELTLSTEEAIVRGVKLSAYGFYFDVQAPSIESNVILLDMMARQRSGMSRPVSATGTVAADPMVAPTPAFDPDREYTTFVREALIDAMLDGSGVLLVAPSERLTVVVSGIDQPSPNPLYRANSNKLILTIAGSDLIEWRQGRLTREQAKERIVKERF
jgi:hypothetical protein